MPAVVSPVRAWWLAARPATLPAAAVPVCVGVAAAVHEGAALRPPVFAATLLAALLIQVGTNFANDYSDFRRGADHDGRLGPTRVTQGGLLSMGAVRAGVLTAFAAAAFVGGWLAWIGGWPIVAIGVASIICGLGYTGGPWPFGYHGLGDVFVFVFFGLVAVTGASYLQGGAWSALVITVSVPVGLLVTNILVVNNLRDRPTDQAAGKRTLAVRIGDRATRLQYAAFTGIAYVVVADLAFTSAERRWLLLPWLTLPLAAWLVREVLRGVEGRALNAILERTGQLLLAFGVLLAAGLAMKVAR